MARLPLKRITREHIEGAITQLDKNVEHPFSSSTTYDVLYQGRRYPPKAVVGLAAKLATGKDFGPRDFGGGEGGGNTNTLLRRLDFKVVPKSTALLTSEDFDLLIRNPIKGPFNELSEKDKAGYRILRERLGEFAEAIKNDFEETSGRIKLKGFVSILSPNGTNPLYMWCCAFPSATENKSYGFQIGLIVKPEYVEIGFFLGSGTGTTKNVSPDLLTDRLQKAQRQLAQLRDRSVVVELERVLRTQEFGYRREYLGEDKTVTPGENEMAMPELTTIKEWVDYASSPNGKMAGISLFVKRAEIIKNGNLDYLLSKCRPFYGLMKSLYSTEETTDTVAPSAPLTLEWLSQKTLWPEKSLQEICDALKGSSSQIVLAGPPGTGKTWLAKHLARFLTQDRKELIRVVQFHPSYSYEEFVEGLRPVSKNGVIEFKITNGVVKEVAAEIEQDSQCRVLIIDEMNRANLSRVFGELMYLFEYRDEPIKLQYSSKFKLPKQLLFVGTMNTADRSIRSIDIALRRRFDVFPCEPDVEILESYFKNHTNNVKNLISGFKKLNETLTEEIDRHHTIGHTFFMQDPLTHEVLHQVWDRKLGPLIEEYFFDQPDLAGEFTCERFWPE